MPPTDGIAINLGDHRLRDLANHAMQVAHLQARRPLFILIAALATDFLIAAGTEMPLLTREHHHANTIIVPGIVECLDHFIDGPWPKGIEYPWTIDADGCHSILFGVDNVFKIRHVTSPIMCMPRVCGCSFYGSWLLPIPFRWGARRDRDRRAHH